MIPFDVSVNGYMLPALTVPFNVAPWAILSCPFKIEFSVKVSQDDQIIRSGHISGDF